MHLLHKPWTCAKATEEKLKLALNNMRKHLAVPAAAGQGASGSSTRKGRSQREHPQGGRRGKANPAYKAESDFEEAAFDEHEDSAYHAPSQISLAPAGRQQSLVSWLPTAFLERSPEAVTLFRWEAT